MTRNKFQEKIYESTEALTNQLFSMKTYFHRKPKAGISKKADNIT